jgi:hypothetical protein
MMRAYNVFWWNKKDGKESVDLNALIVTDSVDKVFDIFRQNFPDNDVELISNIELMTATVVIG